jgi:hypothetical protein
LVRSSTSTKQVSSPGEAFPRISPTQWIWFRYAFAAKLR